MKPLAFWIAVGLAFARLPLAADVVINEVHYDPLEDRLNEEFIELHNTGAAPVDLSGWRLAGGVEYVIPAGTSLAAGGYLVVALDPKMPLFTAPLAPLGPWSGRLSGDGEEVLLKDAAFTTIDKVAFDTRFPWPIASSGDGPSMELINPALDNELGSSWRPALTVPTPGAVNSTLTATPPPNIRQVSHSPKAPKAQDSVTITAKITDAEGMGEAVLHYQVVRPGAYVPAFEPLTRTQLLANPRQSRKVFAGYDESSNAWPTMFMKAADPDGKDANPANDGIYSATLPAEPNRTLVRYYITAKDAKGNEVRAPLKDDPSLNFAYFVYNGVPDYVAATDSIKQPGEVYKADMLTKLPVYHLLTRNLDWMQCLAYKTTDQHPRERMDVRGYYNWSGTIVYGDEVYDNISYRLRGGNGRYYMQGKRSHYFRFNKGHYFEPKDNRGKNYERPWKVLMTSKMFGNRIDGPFGTRSRPGDFGLVDTVNGRLFEMFGVPAPRTHWFHFRVIDDPEELDQYKGDFYGLNLAIERYDVAFLESRGMPKGNLYKLTDTIDTAKDQRRYQAPNAPIKGEDYLNIKNQLKATKDDAWLRKYVHWDVWYRYTAVEEAIRHYDYWATADKNMAYYFEPQADNPLGLFWQLPYDYDASWGPNWNSGEDIPGVAIARKPVFQTELKNRVRDFRDLVWQPEVIHAMIDDAAAVIKDFHPADWDRWRKAPRADGQEDMGTLESKVADMKLFAFVGNLNYPGGNVSAGGRAAWLDRFSRDVIPQTPTISYLGQDKHPVDGLAFGGSPFLPESDATPTTLRSAEWRVGEVTDPSAPAHDPAASRIYETPEVWLATTNASASEVADPRKVSVPPNALKAGHSYRARVRYFDAEGRASHWSAPYSFIASAPSGAFALSRALIISEIMYHPSDPTEAERKAGFVESDFEYIELHNRGASAVDLRQVRFTKGVDFAFPAGTSLAAGQFALIVANKAAFALRHPQAKVLGEWEKGDSLNNGGDRVKLSYGAGYLIHEFSYDDAAPWPSQADGQGPSLQLIDTLNTTSAGLGEAVRWRASAVAGGSPGAGEPPPATKSLAEWLKERNQANPLADPNGDGLSLLAEFALGLDLAKNGWSLRAERRPDGGVTLSHSARRTSPGAVLTLQSSSDLKSWADASLASERATLQGEIDAVRYTAPPSGARYWRLKFAAP